MKKIFTLILVLSGLISFSQSTTVVISQVYGGGGATSGTPTYMYDYVELHNVSNTTQVLTGFSIQYGSATGNFGSVATNVYAFPAGTSIAAGKYLLIQFGAAGTVGAALPVTPDIITPNLTMSASSGKVALANIATALGCGATATTCTLPSSSIIDLVSFGAANNGEGGTTVNNGVALSNTLGGVRKTLGCTDTDNNNLDFDVVTNPVPRNGASAANNCGGASPTLSATTLTAFGTVCINTTTAANSFTITGTTLNATNVTVGALAGFTYSTTVAGTYTTSLSLAQPGGSYSQQIFVKFTPTAVQSYNGNIPVGGGGAASVDVAASGAGINTLATVTTGAASAITQTTATLAGNISANGCSAVTAYGIEYSTTNGFPNGTGTPVASTNLSGGNFSSNVASLIAGTTYYYHAYATNGGGTAYGTQQTFTTIALTPVVTVTPLTAFGNVCINTTSGVNSFTINGTNLTTADIVVGALAGFTYSTTSGGVYTTTLNLTQPGGTYTQQIFVKFNPVLVQSYNGSISVTGGGAPATSVLASGAGINSAATVTSGAASSITQVSATVAGSIPSIGCTAVTVYGIEYSTTNGFPNGTGTAVVSTNLSGANFSSALAGLTPSTTYYYHAYATNGGGTAYGAQGSFTTSAPVLTATPLTAFGVNCINTTVGPNSFSITSTGLLAANVTVGPLNGYSFSTTSAGTYTSSLSLTHAVGPYTQTVYVKFSPTGVQSYNGNIPVGGGGAATINVAVSGSGVNTVATVVTGSSTINSPNSATLNGNISDIGCSPVTSYGIEYSGISGLANGLGTKVSSTNISAGNFSATINGLVQGATYYYKAYAVNNGGIAYGAEKTFTTSSIPGGFVIYGNPVQRGANLHYTYKDIKPGHYEIQLINTLGQVAYQRELIIQVNFIDDNFIVPGYLARGRYSMRIVNPDFRDQKSFMIW